MGLHNNTDKQQKVFCNRRSRPRSGIWCLGLRSTQLSYTSFGDGCVVVCMIVSVCLRCGQLAVGWTLLL